MNAGRHQGQACHSKQADHWSACASLAQAAARAGSILLSPTASPPTKHSPPLPSTTPTPQNPKHIGVTNKYYVEFGFNTDKFDGGSGSNAYVLQKHFGWTGLLLDGRHQNPAINLQKEFISPDNIVSLFDKYGVPAEPDYVSIDIDSIDLWVFRALVQGGYRPRALTIEYNANFPVDAAITQTVEAGTPPGGYDRTFGASLAAIALAADELGYALFQVVQGLDAVLVRKDLVRGVRLRPLETWAACCTNQTVHTIPPPERLGELLDYKVWRDTGDMGTAKQAAREYLAARPYIMSRQQP